MTLRTAVIGVGHLGRQHARIHATVAAEGFSEFVSVCDLDQQTASDIALERDVPWTTDWRELIGSVDAVSLAVPTVSHCEIASALLEAGVHVLVEKPISRTLEEADKMIEAAAKAAPCCRWATQNDSIRRSSPCDLTSAIQSILRFIASASLPRAPSISTSCWI